MSFIYSLVNHALFNMLVKHANQSYQIVYQNTAVVQKASLKNQDVDMSKNILLLDLVKTLFSVYISLKNYKAMEGMKMET